MDSIKSVLLERFGLNAFVRGDYAKAEKWFRRLEAREPDSIRVLRNIGILLLAKGDSEGAEKYLLREEKLYGQSFGRHAGLADLAYARGKRREAEKRYRLALSDSECAEGGKYASSVPLMKARLEICEDESRFKKSRKAMERFIEGQRLRDAGGFEAAVAAFMDSVQLDETNWPGLNNAGSIYLDSLKNPQEAKALFEKAFALSQNIQVARNLDLAMRKLAKENKK